MCQAVGLLLLLLLMSCLLPVEAAASAGPAPAGPEGTIVGGTITVDTTWNLAGSPYIVQTQNVIVADKVKLTIEPGVTVQFNAGRNLAMNGTLAAVGTPTQPITFTRMAGVAQPWGFVQIGGGSVVTDSNDSEISNATIEGGGSGPQMLYVYGSALKLDHVTLRNSSTRGVYVGNQSDPALTVSWNTGAVTGNGLEGIYVATGRVALSNLTIEKNGGDGVGLNSADDSQLLNSTVRGNARHGIYTNSGRLLLEGLTIDANASYGIYMQDCGVLDCGVGSILRNTNVHGNGVAARLYPDTLLQNVTWTDNTRSEIEWVTGRIKSSRTWARLPEISTYRVLGPVTAVDGTVLTIEPGVTVGVQAATHLYIYGTLSAVGTPTQPITFTRMAEVNQPWGHIEFTGGSAPANCNASHISYATLEGGGYGGWMLYVSNCTPALDHLTLRNSSSKGLYASGLPAGATLTWDTGTVTENAGEGIWVYAGRVALRNLTITKNGNDGVELGSANDSQLLNSTVQGNTGNGIHTSSGGLLLEGLTIGANTGYGIYVQDCGSLDCAAGSILRNTKVQDNGVAARLHPDTSLESVTWTGNKRSEIEWILGRINGNRTWARLPEISTYQVLGDITVVDNAALSVEPGVTVQLGEHRSIYANGGFSAVGTAEKPIRFMRLPGATNPWGMIEIGGGNVHEDSDAARVSYATIEGGGAEGKMVHIYYSSASMDHVTVRDGSSIGIQVTPRAGTQVSLDTVAISNNAEVAIYHNQPGPSLSYRHLTLQGNGTDAVSIGSGTINTPVQWDIGEAGAPVRTGTLYVSGGGFLALMPGSRLEFTAAAQLQVSAGSGLYALGTPNAPITLTGTTAQPGAWKGVLQQGNSRAILRNCNIEYGGAGGEAALKIQSQYPVVINCSVRHAAGDGVAVNSAVTPVLRNDDISTNPFGLRNSRAPADVVDARQVWWGDPSGPYHATLNPGGLGNAVSDGVLFQPWLTSVPTGTVPLDGLIFEVAGPTAASPGQSVIYGAVYINDTGQEIRDAVVVLTLPEAATYEEALPAAGGASRGMYWPERHQVFWRLGTLAPGAQGTLAMRVRYFWGITGTDAVLGLIGGSNWAPTRFDVASYLAYQPLELATVTPLTAAEAAAERQAYPVVDTFYKQGEAAGFVYTSAVRYRYRSGTERVVIRMDRPDRTAAMQVVRQGQIVQAYLVDANSFTLRTVLGDMIYDRATDAISFTGGLAGGSSAPAPASGGDSPAFARRLLAAAANSTAVDPDFRSLVAASAQAGPTKEACTANCLELNSDTLVSDHIRRWLSGGSLLPPEDQQAQKCQAECDEDPSRYFCQEDVLTCDFHRGLSFFRPSPEHIVLSKCNKDTGRFEPGGTPTQTCSVSPIIEECTFDDNAKPVCEGCKQAGGCGQKSTIIFAPKDPNAKYGPAGDLLPGQVVTYTVAYENVGAGIAYGVFVQDRLSEVFDENTLRLGKGGQYGAADRTILWDIGQLGPKGSPTASGAVTLTARLRSGLAGGTPIINQAVVTFPSAPEVTPTNQVANVIWPVAGVPVTVSVQAGRSVPITLAGRDTGSGALSFQVVDPPARGSLAGTPPALTYTAPAGFSGQDLFTFRASNAITGSRPAEVTVLVVPDPADTTRPSVTWTSPANGATVPVSTSPAFSDATGPVYMPHVILRFGETIAATTVTTATLRLTAEDGTAVPLTVTYGGLTGEAIALLRQPLDPATTYTVRATQGIKDLAGNPLAADFVSTFRTAGGERLLYLPLLVRDR